jgi:hypothetical protein
MPSTLTYAITLALIIPAAFIFRKRFSTPPLSTSQPTLDTKEKPVKSIMQAAREDLAPPKDDPYTLESLKEFDGSDPSKPIYVSIKGMHAFFYSNYILTL